MEWATKEMDIPFPLNPKDVSHLCRGPQADVLWTFLIQRVRTKEKIAKIRTTLALQGERGEDGKTDEKRKADLIARR